MDRTLFARGLAVPLRETDDRHIGSRDLIDCGHELILSVVAPDILIVVVEDEERIDQHYAEFRAALDDDRGGGDLRRRAFGIRLEEIVFAVDVVALDVDVVKLLREKLRGAVDVLRVFGIGSLAYLVRLRREIDVDGGGDLLHILLRCIGKGVYLLFRHVRIPEVLFGKRGKYHVGKHDERNGKHGYRGRGRAVTEFL